MKRIILQLSISIALFTSYLSKGQNVTNASFENWLIGSVIQKPAGWSTSNEYTAYSYGIYGVEPDTLRSDSFTSAHLITQEVGFGALPYPGFVVNGLMWADGSNDHLKTIEAGEPFTYRPDSLKFDYRFVSPSLIEDWAHAYVVLKRYDSATKSRDTIGYGESRFINPSQNFREYSIPIQYRIKGIDPDSIVISFYSTDPANPTKGAELWVDNIHFDFVTNIPSIDRPQPQVYPNPASDEFSVQGIEYSQISLYDHSGRLVKVISHDEPLDISEISNGVYQLYIESTSGIYYKKLVVSH